ncbi:SAM-dependent methyltransferase [Streptacidiphilus sp. EB103A]|uniref:SAM-dependent methyltransferase n=1 Tax=Streptacidiphilus sp. EB103A TaxID=3156275 RepID=UPI00351544D6
MDWHAWHDDYDRPDSSLTHRLAAVQEQIRVALDSAPPGSLRVISICAGQGHDLLGVLPDHPRREDVTARLVELDPRNAAAARATAAAAGLHQVEVVTGDASLVAQYHDLTPAELVLACGIFGNITDTDIGRTIDHCTRLCAVGGTVVWTRHRREPDLVPQICRWFEDRGFSRVWLSAPDAGFGAAAHRNSGQVRPLTPEPTSDSAAATSNPSMFTFIGYDALPR